MRDDTNEPKPQYKKVCIKLSNYISNSEYKDNSLNNILLK